VNLLTRRKYTVRTVDDVVAARSAWAPRTYGLVLVSLNGFGNAAANLCGEVRNSDPDQLIAMIFHPDQELPATECPTLIFTTEPDEYFLARVETLTEMAYAA
jgi:DNA-binding response OmpR family regulator